MKCILLIRSDYNHIMVNVCKVEFIIHFTIYGKLGADIHWFYKMIHEDNINKIELSINTAKMGSLDMNTLKK
jgi:hypothetical protein